MQTSPAYTGSFCLMKRLPCIKIEQLPEGRQKQSFKLLVIGKVKNPRALKNFRCPVNYDHSETAWMTADIFTIGSSINLFQR